MIEYLHLTTRTKIRFPIVLLLPVLVYVFFYFYQSQSAETLLNFNSLVKYSFTDSLNNGNSSCQIEKIEGLGFRTILRKGAPFPFAGVAIYNADSSMFPLSQKQLLLSISASEDLILPIQLGIYTNTIGHNEEGSNQITLEYLLHVTPFQTDYVLSVSEFVAPQWWLSLHHTKKTDLPSIDLDQVASISFLSSPFQKLDKQCQIQVLNLGFRYDFNSIKIFLLVSAILYYLLLAFLLQRQTRSKQKVFVPIYPLEHLETLGPLEKVKKVMGTRFHLPELSIEMVAEESGVPEYKIATLLKDELDMNFKKYLNYVRIEEAKRRLYETEKRVSEIAYEVGYNHVQNFNRVFKENTQLAPKDFRITIRGKY